MWITIDQLAHEFGIKKPTLQNRLSSGAPMPPSYKFGRTRLFRRSEVDTWIEQSRMETKMPNHAEERSS